MCQLCVDKSALTPKPMQPARRALLKLASASPLWMAGLGSSSMMLSARADDAHPMPKPQNVISPDQALERLMKGNGRYVNGNINTNMDKTRTPLFCRARIHALAQNCVLMKALEIYL